MTKTLAVLLVLAGCGGGAAPGQQVGAAAGAVSVVGTWRLTSDDGSTPQGIIPGQRTPANAPVWLDLRTFTADGSWLRVVEGASYAGTWSETGQDLTVSAANGTAWSGTASLIDCGLPSLCLRLASATDPRDVDLYDVPPK